MPQSDPATAPLDCIVVAGELPREFLGTDSRERMRLQLDGTPASLNFLARYFAAGRDAAAARAAIQGQRRAFVGLNGPYLCQHLADQGLTAARIDLLSDQQEDFAALLARRPPVIVLSTTFLPLAEHIDAMAAAIKRHAPWATVVVGGTQVWKSHQHRRLLDTGAIGADIAPAVCAHNYLMDETRPSPVDVLVVSDRGESTLAALVRRIRDGASWHDLPNLAWQENGRWRRTPVVAEPHRDIAIDWRRHPLPEAPLYLPLQAGQGCGFRCTFCDFCALHPRVSLRDPEAVVAEIRTMPERDGLRRVYFTDDNLFASRARAAAMCRALIDSGMRLRWRGMFRIGIVDAEIAELLARSGCLEVLLGIESGDPAILANMNKRTDPQQALEALALLDRHGINTKSFFIVGFPGETERSVMATVDFLNAYPDAGPAVHRYTLFTFAPLPLAAIASPANRERWQLAGYGFSWRHATMDSDTANDLMCEMYPRIKPELSPSYPLEVPELPGMDPAALKQVYRLRNRLARSTDPGERAKLFDQLETAFTDCRPDRLVAAG
ncbi:MAG: B12-binding domain-containing radical SAM protein [Planctomycetota bacterium]